MTEPPKVFCANSNGNPLFIKQFEPRLDSILFETLKSYRHTDTELQASLFNLFIAPIYNILEKE